MRHERETVAGYRRVIARTWSIAAGSIPIDTALPLYLSVELASAKPPTDPGECIVRCFATDAFTEVGRIVLISTPTGNGLVWWSPDAPHLPLPGGRRLAVYNEDE